MWISDDGGRAGDARAPLIEGRGAPNPRGWVPPPPHVKKNPAHHDKSP